MIRSHSFMTAALQGFLLGCAAFLMIPSAALAQESTFFSLRGGLGNCHLKFHRERQGRVAFLGGSITASSGWRDQVMEYLQQRFPGTQFEFIAAGVPSLGSVPHAFRLETDVLANGPIDLIFVEAAVNDTTNTANPQHMLRGMEGVVRHLRTALPKIDIVQMHFVMPEHMADYSAGKTPVSIDQHERVAEAYQNPSLNLSREVTERIAAGEFTWEGDFKDLHPSPFGHTLYGDSIKKVLDLAFARPLQDELIDHALPAQMIDPHSYARGRYGSLEEVKIIRGFQHEIAWKPADAKGTRAGFVDVPALVATEPGAEFEYTFSGQGTGLFITSGPDTADIEFSIDDSAWRTVRPFTVWSPSLHLPWAVILDDELKAGLHRVRVRVAATADERASGNALRVFHLLLN